jgi:hypothetical protein
MVATVRETVNSENGFVLVLGVLMLAVITVIGVAATRTSETESQIASNERQMASEFYNAEGALIDTLERATTTWLAPTSPFLLAGETGVEPSFASSITDENGNPVANIEIRVIENNGPGGTVTKTAPFDTLSDPANDVPALQHTGPPPAGSGYSMKHFEVRRYGVTTTSTTGNTQIQTGVYKVFNK